MTSFARRWIATERRRVLRAAAAACAAGIAGCAGLSDAVGDLGDAPGVSLAAVDDLPANVPLAFRVELVPPAGEIEGATGVEITLENTADEGQFVGDVDWSKGVFPDRESRPSALRLLTDAEVEFLRTVDGIETIGAERSCAVTEYRPGGDVIDRTTFHRLSPGDGERARYAVVGNAGHLDGGCPPPGRYRFQSQYAYAPAGEVDRARFHEDVDWQAFTWGFSLRVPSR